MTFLMLNTPLMLLFFRVIAFHVHPDVYSSILQVVRKAVGARAGLCLRSVNGSPCERQQRAGVERQQCAGVERQQCAGVERQQCAGVERQVTHRQATRKGWPYSTQLLSRRHESPVESRATPCGWPAGGLK